MQIINFRNEIDNLNPLEQRLYYNKNHWMSFDYNNKEITISIKFITENYKNGITRNEIIEYFKK